MSKKKKSKLKLGQKKKRSQNDRSKQERQNEEKSVGNSNVLPTTIKDSTSDSRSQDSADTSRPASEESYHGPGNTPEMVRTIGAIDRTIGFIEQVFLALSLAALIGVGTYQFLASRLLGQNPTWPFEALRYLVFFTAMGGASLSAQKGRMISMDFISRKLTAKRRTLLRIGTSLFVIFACYLLYQGGMYVRHASSGEEYEVINPSLALLALPIGALLIALHYILHTFSDIVYLAAGLTPPEEEGPQAH